MRWLILIPLWCCAADFDRSRIAVGFGAPTDGAASRPAGLVVCEVSSLDDSGPNTLRSCLVEGREIVFATSGEIVLTSELDVPSFVTIRGETAARGITLRRDDEPPILELESVQDVIVRGIRMAGPGRDLSGAAITLCDVSGVLLDHLVLRNVRTGVVIVGGSKDITISHSLFAEQSNGINVHAFAASCTSTQNQRITIARNVFYRVNERAPRLAGGSSQVQIVNNIIYGWHWFERGDGIFMLEMLGGELPSQVDFVGNAILPGAGASIEGGRAVDITSDVVRSSLFAEGNLLPADEGDLMGLGVSPGTTVDFERGLQSVLDAVGMPGLGDDEAAWVQTVRGAL